jgi:hypothetical protein
MDDSRLSALEQLGRQVAEESDAAADAAGVIHRARRRALDSWGVSHAPRRPRGVLLARLAMAAALVLVVGLGLGLRSRSPARLTFVVGKEAASRPVGEWIAAGDAAVPIRFSEGTELALSSGGRARVTHADGDGASLVLERGSIRAKVVHRSASTRWSFEAGPFEVEVVGTELVTAWDPQHDVVDVSVIEGRVLVRGPQIEGQHAVSAGQRLRVSVREQRVELTPVGPVAAAEPAVAKSTPAAPPPAARDDVAAAASGTACAPVAPATIDAVAPARPAEPDWRQLEARGKHRDAMAAVEREGLAQVLGRASASDLLALAGAARYTGDYARAREVLLAARARGARGSTAFLLGKIEADNLGSTREAIGWFETALAEGSGGFSELALGRLIELKRRAGDAAGAQAAAERYLARYPNGSYKALASAVASP